MPATDLEPPTRYPWWYRNVHRLDRVALATVLITTAVGSFLLLVVSSSPLAVIPPIAVAAGAVASMRWRWAGLVVVAFGPLLALAVRVDPTLAVLLVVIATALLTLRGLRAPIVAVVASLSILIGTTFGSSRGPGESELLVPIAMAIAVVSIVSATKRQAEFLAAMERRAEDAIATRDIESERRVFEERLRIARDLHDVLGHEVAIASVQLSLAEVNADKDVDKTKDALASAREGLQSIMREMQRILEVLRFADDPDARLPTGGLAAVPQLVDSYRRIGMEIDATTDAPTPAVPLDAAVDAAVYRTVQESLTNAQRYGTGHALVAVWHDGPGGVVLVTVANPIDGAAVAKGAGGAGLGLLGMRERIESAGGRLEIREADGTFEVRARLRADGRPIA